MFDLPLHNALLLSTALSGLYVFILYFFRVSSKQIDPIGTRIAIYVSRFVGIGVLAFLLLSPILTSLVPDVIKPSLVVALDDSESIDYALTQEQRDSLLKVVSSRAEAFNNVTVKTVSLSSGKFIECWETPRKATNMVRSLEELIAFHRDQHTAGILVVSDGISNSGRQLNEAQLDSDFGLSTVLLGDTNQTLDFKVKSVEVNDFVFVGNEMLYNVDILCNSGAGSVSEYEVLWNGVVVKSGEFSPTSSPQLETISGKLQPKTAGKYKLSVRLKTPQLDLNKWNDRQEKFVEVIENKLKVNILQRAPHPDIGFIARTLNGQEGIVSRVYPLTNQSDSLLNCDLLICHDCNPIKLTTVPIIYMYSALPPFWKPDVAMPFTINVDNQQPQRIGLTWNKSSAVIDEAALNTINWEGMYTFSGNLKANVPLLELAEQTYNGLALGKSAFVISEDANTPIGIITVSGFWRISQSNGNDSAVLKALENLVVGSVKQLASHDEKKRIRLNLKSRYTEGEKVLLSASYYDETFAPIANGKLKLSLRAESNQVLSYELEGNQGDYGLELTDLDPGKYDYTIEPAANGENLVDTGSFVIEDYTLESTDLRANVANMKFLAKRGRGEAFDINQIEEAMAFMVNTSTKVPIQSNRVQSSYPIDWKWLLFIVLVSFSLEWLLRKRSGFV